MKLYARFLPGEGKTRYGGLAVRQRALIPDENGIHQAWDSGDQNWTEISQDHAEILRNFRLQPWRRNQVCPFEICTAEEVENKARHYRAAKNVFDGVPSVSTARRLDGSGLDGQQGIPDPEAKEAVDSRDQRIAELEGKVDQLLELMRSGAVISPPAAHPADADRSAALGIDDPEEMDGEEPAEDATGKAQSDDGPLFEAIVADLKRVRGIGEKSATALAQSGILGVASLAHAEPETVFDALKAIPGVTKAKCARWIGLARATTSSPPGK